jgi:hypothetical protein
MLFKYFRTLPSGEARLVIVPLVERAAEPLSLDLDVERLAIPPRTVPPSRSARSVYRVKYPFRDLPASRLVLPTSARVLGCARRRRVRPPGTDCADPEKPSLP